MNNVKPGDIARVIADPIDQQNVGKQVYIVGPPQGLEAREVAGIMSWKWNTAVWEVEALQHFGAIQNLRGHADVMKPGTIALACDRFLQRIDPPADSMDLLREEPLPGERAGVPHRSMEDLIHVYKVNSDAQT